jgi:hypothetical protein
MTGNPKFVPDDVRDETFRELKQIRANQVCTQRERAHAKRLFKKSTFLFYSLTRARSQFCAECNAPHPQWASSTLGIFICYSCSGIHRSFGVHLSFVRSLNMDSWKPKELAAMRAGGN